VSADADARAWTRWWRLSGRDALRPLLHERWDPLGLGADQAPTDELDDEALTVAGLLRRGVPQAEIATYLATAFADAYAPTPAWTAHCERVAIELIAWYAASDAPRSTVQ
jgi:hypothetical protein